jgi:ArsR family transcriptional regulator
VIFRSQRIGDGIRLLPASDRFIRIQLTGYIPKNVLLLSQPSFLMATARCCPADCALRSDWEDELAQEKTSLSQPHVNDLDRLMKLLSHPLRLRIILMLLNRDHCVCEFFYVFEEPQNLISYNLKKLRDGGIIESYYRSNHKIYKINEKIAPVIRKIAAAVLV